MAKKTKLYKLVGRQHSGFDEDGKVKNYVTGDEVPLTDTQYEAFGDKFEPIAEAKVEAPKESPKQPAPAQGAGAAVNSANKTTVK